MFLLRSWWARFLIAALLAAVLLAPRSSAARATAWSAFLGAVAATGIGLVRLSGRERADMKLVERSDEPLALRDGTRIAVCGVIEPEGELLESPVWQRPSVLYHFAVLHSEQSSPGVSDTLKDVVDFAGYGATPARVVGTARSVGLGGFPVLYEFESKYIDADQARHNMRDYLRQARFEELEKGEIEWVHIGEDRWDGRARVLRNYRCGDGRAMEQCRFHEASVAPGERVCAIGIWSEQQNTLIPSATEELRLFRGTKESVRDILAGSVGCGRILGFLMVGGSIAAVLYLAGLSIR